MAQLDRNHKRFIVQELARFKSPTEVCESVKETFNLDIERQQVWHYNPNNADVAEEWRELFEETRKQFIHDTASIPIANKNFRLTQLNDLFKTAKEKRNYALAADLLEQAAKEEGGVFTNKRELSGPAGGAIPLDVMSAIDKVYGNAATNSPGAAPLAESDSDAIDTGIG